MKFVIIEDLFSLIPPLLRDTTSYIDDAEKERIESALIMKFTLKTIRILNDSYYVKLLH